MSQASELDRLFDQIDRTPYGPSERSLVETALTRAREAGDEPREFEAMMRRTNSAKMSGDTAAFLESLRWCLDRHAASPSRFPARLNENIDLAWQLKWLPGARVADPGASEQEIDGALRSMERFYEEHDLGMAGVLTARFRTDWAMGRLDAAERWRTRIAETPRDAYSHCDACIRSEVAAFLFDTDRAAEGLAATVDLVANGHECADEPALALARALVPMLRAGRCDEARLWHLRSYESCREEPTQLRAIASQLEHCALTGSLERGFALLDRHLPWLTLDPSDVATQLRAMRAVALFLVVAESRGQATRKVTGAEALAAPSLLGASLGPTAVAPLRTAVREWCAQVAARFDARNGNERQARHVAAIDALARESYPGAVGADATLTRALANREPTPPPPNAR
ncbi:MAG: hypothetical protein JJ863_35330 [Deltaproteobacteria bacterium]|nr:hypothetical protein [Deltaproteobacteria bacterium]